MFKLLKKLNNGVRIGELQTPHGVIHTPFFMPVGTVGSVKGVAPWELEELGAEIILSNTYHLYLRPGEQLIKELGGLHQFMGWNKPILTDSGGYQVFSLAGKENPKSQILPAGRHGQNPKQIQKSKNQSQNVLDFDHSNFDIVSDLDIRYSNFNTNKSLVSITDDGVEFKSHLDGSKHFFTPEKVIQIQFDLGVDILMPLDVCPSGKADYKEIKRATELTIKWAKRAKVYFDKQVGRQSSVVSRKENDKQPTTNDRPLLHGIVQGGLDEDLRLDCAKKLMDMDFDGYSVGGLAVDLETRDMWNIVKLMGEILPESKQRYLMGVGTPDDIITATQLGMDMFDCVLPTRLARHGSVYIRKLVTSSGKGNEARIDERRVTSRNSSVLIEGLRADGRETLNDTGLVTDKRLTLDQYELINLTNSSCRMDPNPIEAGCACPACSYSPLLFKEGRRGGYKMQTGFSKAYISHLLRSKEILGVRLTTLHNLYKYLELMREIKGY